MNSEEATFHIPDRLPPQNIDAEEAILGGILLDPEAINRIASDLLPEAFYTSAHQHIYRAAATLHAQGRSTDLTSVVSWLCDRNLLDRVGGHGKLVQLVDRTVSAVNIDQYAALVRDKWKRRQLSDKAQKISNLAYESMRPLDEILDTAEQEIFSLTQDRGHNGPVPASDILINTFSEIEERYAGRSVAGITTNFYDLDAMTQGLQRSDLIIVAARPSIGKTSFVMNIAQNISKAHGLPTLIFSLEMSGQQLVYRLLSSECGIDSGQLRSGRVQQHDFSAITTAINNLSALPIYIDDSPNISVMEMRSKARRLQAEHGGKMGLVVIDYLQLMDSGKPENRVQELARITRALKGLARELQVPVIALSQLSRGVESRTNKRPMMSDLRESGSIEQDADLIVMLYRDEYYNPDTPDRGITEVIVTKHRNGPTGTIRLLFEPKFTRFRNMLKQPV